MSKSFPSVAKRLLAGAVLSTSLAGMSAFAQADLTEKPDTALITPQLVNELRQMLQSPIVLLTIENTNKQRESLTQADIDELDLKWRAERKSDGVQPTIAAALGSPLSTFLLRKQAHSKGLYNEIFVTDLKGLNVGQSSVTSDFWQGDEDKFLKTVPVGADAVFIDEAEFNDEIGIWLAQVNMTLTDNGKIIGNSTVEINLTELERRSALGL